MDVKKGDLSEEELRKHLIFRLGTEYYATPLVSIKEITKLLPVKKVPYMVPYFRGILNLRGQIVSVIDLKVKFELPLEGATSDLLIVVETENGAIGTLVDDIIDVSDIDPEEVTSHLAVKTKINVEFLKGIGRYKEHLINVIDIPSILSQDEFKMLRQASNVS